MFNKKLSFAVVLFVIILYLLNFRLTSQSSTKHWIVYGTNGCSWTRKQLKHMKDNNISHTFIDCDKKDCKGVKAFPTLEDSSGKKTEGFTLVQ